MRYGSHEFKYAQPFAEELAADPAFRSWVLQRTKFAKFADGSRVLSEEMQKRRSGGSANWWRSHYTEKCKCEGCTGQETDILAIFECANGERFALHFEVKQPSDNFPTDRDQAANYRYRAECWVKRAPRAVLPHADAQTALVCSAQKLRTYALHIPKFDARFTFEEIAHSFPRATWLPASAHVLN